MVSSATDGVSDDFLPVYDCALSVLCSCNRVRLSLAQAVFRLRTQSTLGMFHVSEL
jgi:hypothetical protein